MTDGNPPNNLSQQSFFSESSHNSGVSSSTSNLQNRNSLNKRYSQITRRQPSSASSSSSQSRTSTSVPIPTSDPSFNPYDSNFSNTPAFTNPKNLPALFLPSQHRRQANTLDDQLSDIDDDAFRHSTVSFFTAAEDSSTENLNEIYNTDDTPANYNKEPSTMAPQISALGSSTHIMDSNNHEISAFSPKTKTDDQQFSVPADSDLLSTPRQHQPALERFESPIVSSVNTTPRVDNSSFPLTNGIGGQPFFDDVSTPDQTPSNMHDHNTTGNDRSNSPADKSKLDSPLHTQNNTNQKAHNVKTLGKPFSQEFSKPELKQSNTSGSLPSEGSNNKVNSNNTVSGDVSLPNKKNHTNYWADKNTFPDYDEDYNYADDEYIENYENEVKLEEPIKNNDTKGSNEKFQDNNVLGKEVPKHNHETCLDQSKTHKHLSDVSQQELEPADSLAETSSIDEDLTKVVPRTDVHSRDFSLTTYLEDYYNDSTDSELDFGNENDIGPDYNNLDSTGLSPHYVQNDAGFTSSQAPPIRSIYNVADNSGDPHKGLGINQSTSTVDTLIKPTKVSNFDNENLAHEHDISSNDDMDIVDTIPSASRQSDTSDETSWIDNGTKPNVTTHPVSFSLDSELQRKLDHSNQFSTPATVPLQTPEPKSSVQSTPTLKNSGFSSDAYSPLPLPINRFNGNNGRFSTASDSLRSFGGNETDDTASLSTGRISPQSFTHSNRGSYDFRSNNGFRPGTSDFLNKLNSSIDEENFSDDQSISKDASPNNQLPKTGKWNQLNYISEPDNLAVSDTGNTRAATETSGYSLSATATDSLSDQNRVETLLNSDLLDPSKTGHKFSSLGTNDTRHLPPFSTYADSDNIGSSYLHSDTPKQNSGQDTGIDTRGVSLNHRDINYNESPTSSEQKALTRGINMFPTGTKSETSNPAASNSIFQGGSSNTEYDYDGFKQQEEKNISSTLSQETGINSNSIPKYPKEKAEDDVYDSGLNTNGSAATSNGSKDTITLSAVGRPAALNVENANADYSNKDRYHRFSMPMTPMEPNPEIAELYRNQSELLTRPPSQFLDADSTIPQSQFSSPPQTHNSAIGDDGKGGKKLENFEEEEDKEMSHKSHGQGVNGFEYENLSTDQSSVSSVDYDIKGNEAGPDTTPKRHSRSASTGVKSLILEASPQNSPAHSARTQSSFDKLVRKPSLMSLKGLTSFTSKSYGSKNTDLTRAATTKSLSTRLNRPPTVDFTGVMSRKSSVDRRVAFDKARRAEAEYDSGLDTWLKEVNNEINGPEVPPALPAAKSNTLSSVTSGVSSVSGSISKKPPFLKVASNSIPSIPSSRKMTSALSEVSNKTQGLANKLHINKVGGKSSHAAKGLFSRGKKFLKQGEK